MDIRSCLAPTMAACMLAAPAAAQDETGTTETETDESVATSTADGAQPERPGLFDPDLTFRFDPVQVSARKWDEVAQDVPQGLSVITESTIRDSGIRDVRDASFLVPNVYFTEFTSRRLSFPTVRGIASGIGDLTVTSYVDGVPQLAVSSTNIALLDVERIEFLRGPQGTLYGRNSVGGLIHLHTKRPSNTLEVYGGTTFGNYHLFESTLGVSGPIKKDELYFSLSGLFNSRDGYTRNTFTGNRVDDRESIFGRGQLVWTPNEENEFRFTMYGERSRDGAFTLFDVESLRDEPFEIAHSFDGTAERDIVAPSLTWSHYGDNVDITTVTGFVDWEFSETSDFDFTFIDGVRRFTDEEQTYFSQELRVSSAEGAPVELGDEATLAWMVGGQIFVADGERQAVNRFLPPGVGIFFGPAQVGTDTSQGDFDDLGLAVFGQATVTLWEKLDLSAGLRYDYERKEADIMRTFDPGGFPITLRDTDADESFDEFVPRFSAAYHATEDVMVYGLISRGFKAGGFNLDAPSDSQISFGPETSWSYEAGVKTQWFDDRLQANAAVFYIDWEDLQVSLFDSMAGGYIDNAAEATSAGFELELAARPLRGLEIFTSFGYVDAEFDEFTDQFGMDVSGKNVANVPETTFNVGAQISGDVGRGGRWYVRGEYVHLGAFYYDPGNREEESFGLANFRVGYERRNFRIEGWVRNAFDEEYVLVAFQPSPVDPSFFVGESGAPQTYGLTLSVRF